MKVYLIRNEHSEYKIGYTNRVIEKRLNELQIASPHKLEVVNTFETDSDAPLIESILHRRYAATRLMGEWFDLTEHEVDNFIETCKKIKWNLDFLKENQI